MTTRFLVIAAVMVVVALACMLVPMLRSARREGRPRAPFWLSLLLALATPPVVFALYLAVGTPQALQAVPPPDHLDLAAATAQLRANLADKPDDARGWALLAQAYSTLRQPKATLEALDHLLKLKPDDPDAMVAWVEASAESHPDHLIGDAARTKLQRVLAQDPTHQRALWLLGISDFQRGDYADATRQWETLLPLLQPGSKVAATVQEELAEARSRANGATVGAAPVADPAPAAPGAPPAEGSAAAGAVALIVNVRLDPKLANRLRPGDALFVFARAIDGPPMPLAVTRLHPSRLPVQVTLTDKMAMAPGLELSKYAKVQVAARISKSGGATAEPGDLEAAPVEVATSSRTPIALTIDKVD